MQTQLRPALMMVLLLTLLTGVAYPLLVTGMSQLFFPQQAAGSLIVREGKAIGSKLIGQHFSDPKYFWSRPSATASYVNNALASGGSNLGPLNPALLDAMKARIEALKAADPDSTTPIPVDLVTASASGLDPDISVAAAQYQVQRIARVRGLNVATIQALLDGNIQHPTLGFLGEPRVNVLQLNLMLDEMQR